MGYRFRGTRVPLAFSMAAADLLGTPHVPPTPGRVTLDAARLVAKLPPLALVLAAVPSLSGGR